MRMMIFTGGFSIQTLMTRMTRAFNLINPTSRVNKSFNFLSDSFQPFIYFLTQSNHLFKMTYLIASDSPMIL
ncbi:hypothetical protein Hanom_Chr16g01503901 [Helianthus anomalus]